MNELFDINLNVKIKFIELLVELNEIITKKWQLLVNNGLNSLNEVSNLFQKIYSDEENKNNVELRVSFNDLQKINNEFDNLNKILDSFKSLYDKLKQLESRLFTIFDYDFIKSDTLVDKSFFKDLINSYNKEFELKKVLINEYLFKMRQNRQELVAITCYWMHEPHLNQMFISQLNFLINYYKIN